MATLEREPAVFASLAAPRLVAPVFAATCAVAMMVEGIANAGEGSLYAGLLFVAPATGAIFAARAAAETNWTRVLGALASASCVQVFLALLLSVCLTSANILFVGVAFVVALLTVAATAAVVLPLVIAAGVIGQRRDLEAGDAMLVAGGVWLIAVQLVKMAFVPEDATSFVPALAVGAFAIGVRVARGIARRSWAKRVARGELPGWRVRSAATPEEIATLAALYPTSRGASVGILERVAVGGALYRSGLVGEPVACVTMRSAVSS